MTIYIESFLLQNILINFCLLKLVHVTLRPKTKFFRLLSAAIIGSVFSVTASIYINNSVTINLIKIICAFTMIIFAFKQSAKNTIISFLLLFVYTYTFGGAITNLATNVYTTSFGVIYASKISLEAITLIIIIITYIFEKMLKYIKFKIKINNLLYPVTFYLNGNQLQTNAYLDTGNLLNFDGNPVVILDLDAYLKLSGINLIKFYLTSYEKVATSTVNGKNGLNIIKIDQMDVKLKNEIRSYKNQYIAINTGKIFKNTNYQALLTPLIM